MSKKGTVKKSKKRLFFSKLLTHFWPVFPFIFSGGFSGGLKWEHWSEMS